jgi:hypothetical protein
VGGRGGGNKIRYNRYKMNNKIFSHFLHGSSYYLFKFVFLMVSNLLESILLFLDRLNGLISDAIHVTGMDTILGPGNLIIFVGFKWIDTGGE